MLESSKPLVALVVAALAVLTLTSCTAAEPSSAGGNHSSGGDAPTFNGPWAAEFEQRYQQSDSDFVRSVLADSKVTDQEMSETTEAFKSCLSVAGIVITGTRPDGGYDTSFPSAMSADESHDKTLACSHQVGEDAIGSLYQFVRRNPDHLDEATIMAGCLATIGVVPGGYSANDYNRDAPTGSFPFALETASDETKKAGQDALARCAADPLGLFIP